MKKKKAKAKQKRPVKPLHRYGTILALSFVLAGLTQAGAIKVNSSTSGQALGCNLYPWLIWCNERADEQEQAQETGGSLSSEGVIQTQSQHSSPNDPGYCCVRGAGEVTGWCSPRSLSECTGSSIFFHGLNDDSLGKCENVCTGQAEFMPTFTPPTEDTPIVVPVTGQCSDIDPSLSTAVSQLPQGMSDIFTNLENIGNVPLNVLVQAASGLPPGATIKQVQTAVSCTDTTDTSGASCPNWMADLSDEEWSLVDEWMNSGMPGEFVDDEGMPLQGQAAPQQCGGAARRAVYYSFGRTFGLQHWSCRQNGSCTEGNTCQVPLDQMVIRVLRAGQQPSWQGLTAPTCGCVSGRDYALKWSDECRRGYNTLYDCGSRSVPCTQGQGSGCPAGRQCRVRGGISATGRCECLAPDE